MSRGDQPSHRAGLFAGPPRPVEHAFSAAVTIVLVKGNYTKCGFVRSIVTESQQSTRAGRSALFLRYGVRKAAISSSNTVQGLFCSSRRARNERRAADAKLISHTTDGAALR